MHNLVFTFPNLHSLDLFFDYFQCFFTIMHLGVSNRLGNVSRDFHDEVYVIDHFPTDCPIINTIFDFFFSRMRTPVSTIVSLYYFLA